LLLAIAPPSGEASPAVVGETVVLYVDPQIATCLSVSDQIIGTLWQLQLPPRFRPTAKVSIRHRTLDFKLPSDR